MTLEHASHTTSTETPKIQMSSRARLLSKNKGPLSLFTAETGGEFKHLNRGSLILIYTSTVQKAKAKLEYRVSMTLIGCCSVPFRGLGLVLRDPFTIGKANPKVELSSGIPLLGSRSIPFRSFGLVLYDPFTLCKANPQLE
eukprot:RCo041490